MEWIELTIKTTSAAIDLVCDRLTVLGYDSFIIDNQEDFHQFLEQNRQYWDYVDEDLEQKMRGSAPVQDPNVTRRFESLSPEKQKKFEDLQFGRNYDPKKG